MHTNGAILRDDLAWNEYWLWDPDDMMQQFIIIKMVNQMDMLYIGYLKKYFI